MSVKAFAVLRRDLSYKKIVKNKSVIITDTKGEKTFGFDAAFNTTEIDILYKSHLSGIVSDALSGYNVNVTCCGIAGTGSGQVLHGSGFDARDGAVPAAIKDLFHRTSNGQFLISASMLQIDGSGVITDVLNPHSRKMRVRKSPKLGIIVDNLTSYVVSNAAQACQLYSEGCKTEKELKARQSKMHTRDVVFTLTVSQKQDDPMTSGILSKITFLDLIGHEAEPDNIGIKALMKSMSSGKLKDQSPVAYMIIGDAISQSKSVMIGCFDGEESQAGDCIKLLELAKLGGGMHTNPHKNNPDISVAMEKIRKEIKVARQNVMQHSVPNKDDVAKLETYIAELTDLKNTTWNRRIAVSNLYTSERKSNLSDRGLLWVMQSSDSSSQNDIKALHDQISQMSGKLKELKSSTDKMKEDLKKELDNYTASVSSGNSYDQKQTKARVGRIQSMKEAYKAESDTLSKARENLKEKKDQLRRLKEAGLDTTSFSFEMTAEKLQEDRNRTRLENEHIVNAEIEKMKIEVDHEKAVLEMTATSVGLGLDDEAQLKQAIEIASLKLEKSVVTTQLDILRKERSLVEDHVRVLTEKHAKQMEIQQLQNLETFRAYREVFEEFKTDLDTRWRGLLDDAIQDAVFLNSRNSELKQENDRLKLEMKRLQDQLSLSGTQPANKIKC